jgi:hypothetical protein
MADPVATLREALLDRYAIDREIKLAARLPHPHILTVHSSGEAAAPDLPRVRAAESNRLETL